MYTYIIRNFSLNFTSFSGELGLLFFFKLLLQNIWYFIILFLTHKSYSTSTYFVVGAQFLYQYSFTIKCLHILTTHIIVWFYIIVYTIYIFFCTPYGAFVVCTNVITYYFLSNCMVLYDQVCYNIIYFIYIYKLKVKTNMIELAN